jgi:hypothetical protein
MRLKTLAIMAIVGVFSTSFAYAADDMSTNSSPNAGSDNIGASQSNTETTASNSNSNANGNSISNPSSADSSNNNDDMSADTATGDDDY